ncbi:hypothetical protein MCOR02_010613 [Pyricularia oryzae]|uniref:Rhodopsin domain-containing protein n=3 Tax=Pyricularia TaxID=48558 RepID=A0ABQ8P1C3_PYRGI|nr:uncharacterized protein MGG_04682 [Pyricularia oryzae 70-15]KAH9429204.1 hypothetical protein MCOR02_010613 [Pyricularia oryzae]KAI6304906.1 hypothetical protein MCOR33_000029 [Pyricularia grisea]EHA58238.1 hypothetical protein MGG_04682 [Pyricularia oryzae 70-15]KAI6262769.1 hypothetical protein MCOR19_001109 [Pyricularia oryzae]KAI6288282.1 hypothetical protein MCOR26_000283 [Pyricularia oryzae]
MSTPNSTDGTAEPKYEPIRIENGDQIGMLVVSIFCMVVPTVTVIMRFMARARVARDSRFSMSDWLLIPCLVALYGLSIANFLMVFEGGFTYDQSTIPTRFGPDTLVAFLKCMAAWPIIWNCAIFTSKLSVLLMYSMLMPVRNMVLAVRCCAVFLALYNLSGIIAGFTICQPFSKNWDVSGQEPGHCGDVRLFYQWLSGINVFCDLLLFLLPMPVLYTLKLAPRKKIVLAALLCVGVLTVIITIYRQTLLTNMDNTNVTGTTLFAFLFSNLEIAFAVILACVPLLRPLFRGTFGGGSSNNSNPRGTGSNTLVPPTIGGGGGGMSGGRKSKPASRGFAELDDDDADSAGSKVELQTYGNKKNASVSMGDRGSIGGGRGGGIMVETRWEVESHEIARDNGHAMHKVVSPV